MMVQKRPEAALGSSRAERATLCGPFPYHVHEHALPPIHMCVAYARSSSEKQARYYKNSTAFQRHVQFTPQEAKGNVTFSWI